MSADLHTERARANAPEAVSGPGGRDATEKLQLKIGGLSCSFCVASITKALGQMDGVHEANVNLAHEEALIEYEPGTVSPGQLKETLLDLGYTVRDADKVPDGIREAIIERGFQVVEVAPPLATSAEGGS